MTAMVMADDFLNDNYLSTERRIPVTLLQTNACSPLATNALAGNIWDNFSSQTYQTLPSVGKMTLYNPIDGTPFDYEIARRRPWLHARPPSLISLWSTAPFLLNNSVGKFRWEASVEARMDSFNDAIQQMLWPEKRKRDVDVIKALGLPESKALNVPGFIHRDDGAELHKSSAWVSSRWFREVAELGRVVPACLSLAFWRRNDRDRSDPQGNSGQLAYQP